MQSCQEVTETPFRLLHETVQLSDMTSLTDEVNGCGLT